MQRHDIYRIAEDMTSIESYVKRIDGLHRAKHRPQPESRRTENRIQCYDTQPKDNNGTCRIQDGFSGADHFDVDPALQGHLHAIKNSREEYRALCSGVDRSLAVFDTVQCFDAILNVCNGNQIWTPQKNCNPI